MSTGTVLIVIGLAVALVGVGFALVPVLQGRPALSGVPDDTPVHEVADVLAHAGDVVRRTDRDVRAGVAVAVVGLLLAGIGAWLGSDARALGTDVGGSGSSDRARVGGTW